MAIVALWTSLGIYFASLAVESAVEMRRVARRKKGKKSMEPYRYCRTYLCPGFHVPRTYRHTICQSCCLPLYEPPLEELADMTLPDDIDVAAAMAHADFNSRFGVDVDVEVAWYLRQLEQRYNVRVTATPNHAASLPVVVQRQSTPPPALTPEDMDCAYADLSQMKADLKRMEYVIYMRDVHGIFCSSSKEMHLP